MNDTSLFKNCFTSLLYYPMLVGTNVSLLPLLEWNYTEQKTTEVTLKRTINLYQPFFTLQHKCADPATGLVSPLAALTEPNFLIDPPQAARIFLNSDPWIQQLCTSHLVRISDMLLYLHVTITGSI